MILNIIEYPLFENMLFLNVNQDYFDLHNDFDFESMTFSNEKLEILFKGKDVNILMIFLNVEFKHFNFYQLNEELIVDNIYRGKFEVDKNLFEQDELNRKYFYLEFTENVQFEFLSSEVQIMLSE